MENCLPHVTRVIFRICDARSCQSVAEGVVERSEGGVLRVCGAICDARFHRAAEGAGEKFGSLPEYELDGALKCRGGDPLVDRFVLSTLGADRVSSRVVAEHKAM